MSPNAETVFVPDVLNGCEEPSGSSLIQERLSTFSKKDEDRSGRLKVLVTSQPTADLELAFRGPCKVSRIRAEDQKGLMDQQIERVIRYRMEQLVSKQMPERKNGDVLRFKLEYSAKGSFLYIDAVFKCLTERGSHSESSIVAAVEDAKRELDRLYEQEMPTATRETVDLFQWLLANDERPPREALRFSRHSSRPPPASSPSPTRTIRMKTCSALQWEKGIAL